VSVLDLKFLYESAAQQEELQIHHTVEALLSADEVIE